MKFTTVTAISICILFNLSLGCDLNVIVTSQCSYSTVKEASGCTESDLISLLGYDASSLIETKCQEAKNNMYDNHLPWNKVSSRGAQFDDTFFDGGTIFNTDDGEAISGFTVAEHPETQRIVDIQASLLHTHGISWPGDVKNFDTTDSCQSRAAMCCWVSNRNGNGNVLDNTDVCHHDIANSDGSAHVEGGEAFFYGDVFGDVKCDGFLWSDHEEPYKGNILFKVAMEDGLLNGNVRNVPGAPMCACLEQMPTVTTAGCTNMTVIESYEITYDDSMITSLKIEGGDLDVSFGNCGGLDLPEYYYLMNDDTSYLIEEQFKGSCEETVTQKTVDIGFTKQTQEWIPVAGRGLLYYPTLAIPAFNEVWALSNNQILRRRCLECDLEHMDIYYRRFDTDGLPEDLDLLHVVKDYWQTDPEVPSNTFMVDFKLYSTYEDAKNDTNHWLTCDFDSNRGFPSNCGPYGEVSDQWNSFSANNKGKYEVAFYVENGGDVV